MLVLGGGFTEDGCLLWGAAGYGGPPLRGFWILDCRFVPDVCDETGERQACSLSLWPGEGHAGILLSLRIEYGVMDGTMSLLRFSFVVLLACTALAGCVTHQPVALYRLDNGVPHVPEQTGGAAVLLGPVTLADYLQREVILQRQADGSLSDGAAQAQWAGSLEQDIDQLLLRQLAWRLQSQQLELSPAREGFAHQAQIEIAITRLDSGPEQPAVLEAKWRVLDRHGKQQASRLVRMEEAHQGSTADQIRAQSALLQRLSAQLASAVEPVLEAQSQEAKAAPSKKKSVSKKSAEASKSRLPAIETIRTDMEVFRF